MPGGEDTFARALGRLACLQLIYAQAERLSTHTTPRHGARGAARGSRPVSAAAIHATESVADAMADIAAAFVETVARAACARAQLAGRSSANLLDVQAALDALAPVTNSNARDLARYAMVQEVPFPRPVPRFPVLPPTRKRPREVFVPALAAQGEGDEPAPAPVDRLYIEPWMPSLPSAHTYVATPVYVKPEAEKRDAACVGRQRRRVEKTLAQLKESKAKAAEAGKDGLLATVAVAAPENPFLALPKVGKGRVFDEDIAGDARELTEKPEPVPSDALDSNKAALVDMPKNAANDQKIAKVDRILAEAGGTGTTALSGQ